MHHHQFWVEQIQEDQWDQHSEEVLVELLDLPWEACQEEVWEEECLEEVCQEEEWVEACQVVLAACQAAYLPIFKI